MKTQPVETVVIRLEIRSDLERLFCGRIISPRRQHLSAACEIHPTLFPAEQENFQQCKTSLSGEKRDSSQSKERNLCKRKDKAKPSCVVDILCLWTWEGDQISKKSLFALCYRRDFGWSGRGSDPKPRSSTLGMCFKAPANLAKLPWAVPRISPTVRLRPARIRRRTYRWIPLNPNRLNPNSFLIRSTWQKKTHLLSPQC